VRVVREIRSLQAIGFSLADVRPFVECMLAGHESGDECPASADVYRRKLAYLDRHITELHAIRDQLASRIENLPEPPPPACELLTAMRAHDSGSPGKDEENDDGTPGN
jgi:DNA-binding transcriptional MerR regulator